MSQELQMLINERNGKQRLLDEIKSKAMQLRSELQDCETTIQSWTKDIQNLDCKIRYLQSQSDIK